MVEHANQRIFKLPQMHTLYLTLTMLNEASTETNMAWFNQVKIAREGNL